MTNASDHEFALLLKREGRSLASFVLALVGDRHLADDLYQSTCLELWRIRKTFQVGTDFGAWSRTVARYQVQRHWRKAGRERIAFSSEAIDRIAEVYQDTMKADDNERMQEALRTCLEALPGEDRDLLRKRYNGTPLVEIARETGRTEGGLKMRLFRLREKLGCCVRSKMEMEARHE